MEWDAHRAQVLQTDRNESLAATIELSLTSPTFQKLGPDARELLEVVAFFPQGVDKKNLDWLFSTIPNRKKIFDKFCALSLTHRVDDFITMLAPIRDYLGSRGPRSSPLLRATKDRYFTRLSVDASPGSEEAQWIRSEDVNIEHLLVVFTSIDTDAVGAFDACAHFIERLCWYKPRQTVLGPKIEGLPDDHPSKTECLSGLSRLLHTVGNFAEQKRILSQVVTIERKRGSGVGVAKKLQGLSNANRLLGLYEEGIQQAREALEIYEQFGDTMDQAECLRTLAFLLWSDEQLDAAEEAVTRAIDLLPEKDKEGRVCRCQKLLGDIYLSKGERQKAIHHYKVAIEIGSHFKRRNELFWIHYSLAQLFRDEGAFDDANTYIGRAKSLAGGHEYYLGRAAELRALILYLQGKLEEARSEILCAKEICEKLGSETGLGNCSYLLQKIEEAERQVSLE